MVQPLHSLQLEPSLYTKQDNSILKNVTNFFQLAGLRYDSIRSSETREHLVVGNYQTVLYKVLIIHGIFKDILHHYLFLIFQ